MSKDVQNMALDLSGSDITMEVVMKNIYTSCDPNNLNSVPTSELIEFIRPYLLEDLSALETLKQMLDPENKNISVPGEKFYNVMNEWTQKIASHSDRETDGVFNVTPSHLNVLDEKLLPYSQSTPRASFGQKLLSCEGLLNLSNVSSYNLSPTKQTKEISIGPEKTILEEEVKQLQYQLSKVLKEMEDLKVQLACTEDQNDVLQDNLEKCKLRLQSEQHVNDHLQDNKNCVDDLKEEISVGKKRIEELNKKLLFYEKDSLHLNNYVQRLEKENSELEERCRMYDKNENNMRKEHVDLRTELDMKEHEVTSLSKINEELRLKLCEKMAEMEQLLNENELLDYKQQGLEKMLSSKRYSLSSHYSTCLDELSFLMRGSTIPIYSSPLKNKSFSNNPSFRKTVLSPNPNMLQQVLSSTPKHCNGLGMRKAFSLNTMSTRSLPNIFCLERSTIIQDQGGDGEQESQATTTGAGTYESLQTELFQVDPQFDHKDKNGRDFDYEEQIYLLQAENEALQSKLDKLEEEKKNLGVECTNIQDKAKELEKKLSDLMLEKQKSDETVTNTIKHLEDKLQQINDEYSKLKLESDQRAKEVLELRNKVDFEPFYKKLETDYAKKIEELENLQQSFYNAQIEIESLNNSKKELEQSLKHYKIKVFEAKDKLKHKDLTNENTSDESVEPELKELRNKVQNLEGDLEDKKKYISRLKEVIKSEGEIKNKLWGDNEDLRRNLDKLTEDYKNQSTKLTEVTNTEENIQTEYKKTLSKYKEEVSKNAELYNQLSNMKEDHCNMKLLYNKAVTNYEIELNKNLKLLEQISLLKQEVNNFKECHKTCKNEILVELSKYEAVLSKLKDLESENSILKGDLSLEKQNSRAKLSLEIPLKDCIELNEEKTKRYLDVDTSSESSPLLNNDKTYLTQKHRSFDKQNLTIDRLRDELRHEKDKYELLKKKLNNKVEELKNAISEKQTLQTVINDLRLKLEEQEVHHKHSCNASNQKIKDLSHDIARVEEKYKNTLSNLAEKESILKLNFVAQEYNKTVIQKLDKDNKDCQYIQNRMSADLAAREVTIKNLSAENQKLANFAKSVENKSLELAAKLSQQECALKKHKLDLASKNEELAALSSLLLDRETKIQNLCSTATAYEIKMSNIALELSEKEEAYLKLERELKAVTESLAEAENMIQNTLVSSEQKANSELEFEQLNEDVKDETTLEKISSFTDVIVDCCEELNGAFMNFIQKWRNEIESHPNFKKLPSIKLCHSLNIEDILSVLVDNIKAVISLLNIVASKAPEIMNENQDSHLQFLINQRPTEFNDTKPVKKFTLTSKAESRFNRSVSPDSPGIEVESEICDIKNEYDSENNSPDSQNHIRSFEYEGQGEDDFCSHSNSHLPLLNFELPFQDAFPHLSDSILGKLGLHESSPKVKLTKEETEEIFTALAIQVGLDSKDIRGRLHKQKDSCTEKYRKYQYLLKDISMRLREHHCIGASDSIKPVFVMLEDLRFITQDLLQSAGQLGVLNCEHRMTKCWNLVTNYMAILKQDVETSKHQFSPNRSLANKSLTLDEMDSSNTRNKHTKENTPKERSCLSNLTHCVLWISFFSLLFVVGVICVHYQCKMTTEYKICPLDDLVRMITERVGEPPY